MQQMHTLTILSKMLLYLKVFKSGYIRFVYGFFFGGGLKEKGCDMTLNVSVDVFLPLQTHAEETLAKADTALRQKEVELSKLKEEHQALRTELTALRQGLSTSTERAEKLHEEVQVGIGVDHTLSDKMYSGFNVVV